MIISLTPITYAQLREPSFQLTPSVTITNIDSPNTPIKQGAPFIIIVMIENTYSTPQDIEIRFEIENTKTEIIVPTPDLIQLKPGLNEHKYNFETSQNAIPGNYVVNIQLRSDPNPDSSTLTVLPKPLDQSNFEIIIEEPIQVSQPPLNFEAKAISSSEIKLSWQKPRDDGGSIIKGYKIEYYEGNFDGFKILESNIEPTSTTYDHTDLKPGATYTYQIFAINSAGTSKPSDKVSATTDKLKSEIIIEADRSNYQTDSQSDIIVTVTGKIENPYEDSSTVKITLEKLNDSHIFSIPQNLPLETNGEFQTQFHLDPEKFTTGSYVVKAIYDNLEKSVNFGIFQIQPRDNPPHLIVPTDITKIANSKNGYYINSFNVSAIDVEDGDNLVPNCTSDIGWFAIGNYTVNCTVTDSNDSLDEDRFRIIIKNAHPVSKISVLSPNDSFEIDKPISFSAKGSYDPDGGTITQYLWNFRDDSNSPIITTSPEISHSYKKEGTFDVSLDVIDDENSRSNHSGTVKIPVSANYIWIIIIILVCAVGGGGVIAAKYLLKPKSKISTHQDLSIDNKPENDNDPKKQSSIDMDIEFRSGVEKK